MRRYIQAMHGWLNTWVHLYKRIQLLTDSSEFIRFHVESNHQDHQIWKLFHSDDEISMTVIDLLTS